MSLEPLLSAVTAHYTDRGFPSSALKHLIETLKGHYQADGTLVFRGVYDLQKRVERLVQEPQAFPRWDCAAPSKEKVRDADAILAFSCGYRLRKQGDGGVGARLPGLNNHALAEIAVALKTEFQLPLYAQFEIADAIEDRTDSAPDYRTPSEDMGTSKVITYFVNHRVIKNGSTFRKVIVVAHRHHIGRCLILLGQDFGITAYPYGKSYEKYDPHECQRRASNANELIVSDFVSMAARAK
jgi:hypothetical protein